MKFASLVFEAYLRLVRHDCFMRSHDFAALYRSIKVLPTSSFPQEGVSPDAVAAAVDLASAFYPKQVLCLQRSAVTVQMLRRRGIPATLVIGAQKLPFKAHAWVEVDHLIVNDRLAKRESFLILEVC